MNEQNLKPFVKGDPRINRTGANRGHRHWTTTLKEAAETLVSTTGGEKLPIAEVIVKKALTMAANGDVQLIKYLWDRNDGKVIDRTGQVQVGVQINFQEEIEVSEKVEKLAAEILDDKGGGK